MKKLASTLAIALMLTGIAVPSAFARTIPGLAGMNTALGSANEFAWLQTGILAPNATAASPKHFGIPIPLDTGGNKSFIIRGTPSVTLTCTVDQRGSVNSSVAIPVSNIGAIVAPVVVNVVPGNTVVVICRFTSSNGRVLLVDYTP